jgi:hypothetical protein
MGRGLHLSLGPPVETPPLDELFLNPQVGLIHAGRYCSMRGVGKEGRAQWVQLCSVKTHAGPERVQKQGCWPPLVVRAQLRPCHQ